MIRLKQYKVVDLSDQTLLFSDVYLISFLFLAVMIIFIIRFIYLVVGW